MTTGSQIMSEITQSIFYTPWGLYDYSEQENQGSFLGHGFDSATFGPLSGAKWQNDALAT